MHPSRSARTPEGRSEFLACYRANIDAAWWLYCSFGSMSAKDFWWELSPHDQQYWLSQTACYCY